MANMPFCMAAREQQSGEGITEHAADGEKVDPSQRPATSTGPATRCYGQIDEGAGSRGCFPHCGGHGSHPNGAGQKAAHERPQGSGRGQRSKGADPGKYNCTVSLSD